MHPQTLVPTQEQHLVTQPWGWLCPSSSQHWWAKGRWHSKGSLCPLCHQPSLGPWASERWHSHTGLAQTFCNVTLSELDTAVNAPVLTQHLCQGDPCVPHTWGSQKCLNFPPFHGEQLRSHSWKKVCKGAQLPLPLSANISILRKETSEFLFFPVSSQLRMGGCHPCGDF